MKIMRSIIVTALICLSSLTATSAQELTIPHVFLGGATDGASSYVGLILATDGNIYGVTNYGGASNAGVVYKLAFDGTYSILHQFNGADGSDVESLMEASDGNLYGTSYNGGSAGCGVIFQITKAGGFRVIHNFNDGTVADDGSHSNSGLVEVSGSLYGTTPQGGTGSGVVFKCTLPSPPLTGTSTCTILYAFGSSGDGIQPVAALTLGLDGNLYGTTQYGGTYGGTPGNGTVFKINPTTGVETVIHNLGSSASDGLHPVAPLTLYPDGNFYGTTQDGAGTAFKITPSGVLTTLYSFTNGTLLGSGPTNLLLAADGNFYGANSSNSSGAGSIFQMTPGGIIALLHILNGPVEGSISSGLTQVASSLYGVTRQGGSSSNGTIYRLQCGQVAAGFGHTVAVTLKGNVWSWGQNSYGQLGVGGASTDSILYPSQVPLTNAIGVAAGYSHSVALTSNSQVWTWGQNFYGQLGDGGTTNTVLPKHITALDSSTNAVVAIASGSYHTLALRNDGTVLAWGNNSRGQLGFHSLLAETNAPVQVLSSPTLPLTNIVAISAGANDSLALSDSGQVWSWGDNSRGQLGIGSTTSKTAAVLISGLTNVVAISAGASHNLALQGNGKVYAWGDNSFGEIGDGTTNNATSPVQITSLGSNIISIAAGGYATNSPSGTNGAPYGAFSSAINVYGTNYAWGSDSTGQLCDGFSGSTHNQSSPQHITGLDPAGQAYVTSLVSGAYFGLAVKSDGTVLGWGQNSYGQLGNATNAIAQRSPVAATNISGGTPPNFSTFSN